jgi:TPP-dependent pyruvate/acetoin dehydrogenase alpha subunit
MSRANDFALVERLYRKMRLIRRAEEATAHIYPSDKIKSPVHLAIGQEQNAVAICDNLKPDDVVGGTYRSHAVYLAKGGDLSGMFAEMYGKDTGCARGKGGSMHLVDMKANVLGSSAVVGTNIPIVAGYALAMKREGKGRVAVAFFGDGASEEGCFYETLNFAALHALPMLFVCENNFYAIHEPISKRRAKPENICTISEALGVPAHRVADGDIFALHELSENALARIRNGEGPELLECHGYRWREHVGPNEDYSAGYREREEAIWWMENDQLKRLTEIMPNEELAKIDIEIEAAIAKAIDFAENSPFPESEELWRDVYA